jgi:ABC-type transporter Mla subunit MlaD
VSARKDTIVGGLLILAVAGLAAGLVARHVGRELLGATRRHFFVRASDGRNIREQAPVRMLGLTAGMVERIALEADGGVVVHFRVEPEFGRRIRADSSAAIVEAAVAGQTVGLTRIEVKAGSPDQPEARDGELPNRDPESLGSVLEKQLDGVKPLLAKLDGVSARAASIGGTVEWLASDIDSGDGFVSRLQHDAALGRDLDRIGARVATAVADLLDVKAVIDRKQGALGELVGTRVLEPEVDAVVAKSRETLAGIDAIVERLSKATSRASRQLDRFASTLSGANAVMANVRRVTGEVAAIGQRIAGGRGTVGRYLGDKTIVAELKRFLKDLAETGRDSSEMSPINTVTGLGIKQVPRPTAPPTQGVANAAQQ